MFLVYVFIYLFISSWLYEDTLNVDISLLSKFILLHLPQPNEGQGELSENFQWAFCL